MGDNARRNLMSNLLLRVVTAWSNSTWRLTKCPLPLIKLDARLDGGVGWNGGELKLKTVFGSRSLNINAS